MSRRLLSHLAHAELLTPELEKSVSFFTDVLGLHEVEREGDSVYLRCWGDYYRYSVILTEAEKPGLGHSCWRVAGPDDLEEAASAIEATGISGEWVTKSLGHGRSYKFVGPGGHKHELVWDIERFVAPKGQESTYPERPQRMSTTGVAPRQLDHLTVATPDLMDTAAWYRDTLGFRFMAYSTLDHDPDLPVFAVMTTNEKSHDLGLGAEFGGDTGRIHHLAFWVDSREELLRAAEVVLEAGFPVEYGPGKHGIGEQNYLYFRFPGGGRIEINTGGYRNYVPDWEPVQWLPSQGSNTMYRNTAFPDSMMEAFPHSGAAAMPEPDAAAAAGGVENPWGKPGSG